MSSITGLRSAILCLVLLTCTAPAKDEKFCKDLLHRVGNSSIGLPFDQFDQNDGTSWRLLESSGCHSEAELLLGAYLDIQESQIRIVKWHLAQVLATEGNAERASEKAMQSLDPDEAQQNPGFKWNAYVLATVAFLRGDRASFNVQYELLRAAAEAHPENNANLAVLTCLSEGFGGSYKDAYNCRVAPQHDVQGNRQ